MVRLTNGLERPQLSSKFNLVSEVDSPYSGISREHPIRFNPNSTSQKSRGPSNHLFPIPAGPPSGCAHSRRTMVRRFDRSYYLIKRGSDYLPYKYRTDSVYFLRAHTLGCSSRPNYSRGKFRARADEDRKAKNV